MNTKQLIKYFFIALLFIAASCGKKADPQTQIAGNESKVWRAVKEKNSEGKKESLGESNDEQVLRFYTNGTFTVNTNAEHGNGTWFYDAGTKAITLKFKEQETTETFDVLELADDKMVLRAADRSEMVLKADS